jgi:hypothetical protein
MSATRARHLLILITLAFIMGAPIAAAAPGGGSHPVPAPLRVTSVDSASFCHVPDETGAFGPCDPVSLLDALTVADVDEAELPSYNRAEWNYPRDNCPNTRGWVLLEETMAEVTYTRDDNCFVASGHWFDPYTGQEFTDAALLWVDHLVPLADAHYAGGWAWSPEQKAEYANDFSYPAHLMAVYWEANQDKGRHSPDRWWPVEAYWCQYATDWVWIKHVWELSVTTAEWQALAEMLATC